ncbi:MAG: N-formylglutamate amidohydrolase [Albidovulum sp.]
MTKADAHIDALFALENRDGSSDVLLVCEHASNHFPPAFGTLGLPDAARKAHIAWDPGALGLARGLAQRLDAGLAHAGVSRLIYDLNRAPNEPGAIAEKSEAYEITGNTGLTSAQRWQRTEAVYLPFHHALHTEIARRIALGRPPVLITIHSFTPVYFGKAREVEFGVIHDQDPRLAHDVVANALAMTQLKTALNEPYSAADAVTHTLRLHATPYGLRAVMLEIRNDLLASPEAEAKMADLLAPVLRAAIAGRATATSKKAVI